MSKLSNTSRYLLRLMRQHGAISITAALPSEVFYIRGGRPGMVHLRGLERRGWVIERSTGLFYLTDAGKEAADADIASGKPIEKRPVT